MLALKEQRETVPEVLRVTKFPN